MSSDQVRRRPHAITIGACGIHDFAHFRPLAGLVERRIFQRCLRRSGSAGGFGILSPPAPRGLFVGPDHLARRVCQGQSRPAFVPAFFLPLEQPSSADATASITPTWDQPRAEPLPKAKPILDFFTARRLVRAATARPGLNRRRTAAISSHRFKPRSGWWCRWLRRSRRRTRTLAGTHAFEAEVAKLLSLMVHSVYSNRDVFLRELISNAADACEKLRMLALDKPELLADDPTAEDRPFGRQARRNARSSRTTASA